MANRTGGFTTLPYEDDPLQAAAHTTTRQTAPYQTSSLQQTRANQNAQNIGAGPVAGTQPVIQPGQGWVGGLNQAGIQSTMNDENAFWANYGNLGATANGGSPWQAGGNLEGFMSQTFNPRELGAATFTGLGQYSDPNDVIMGQSKLADQLLQTGNTLDPGAIVGNVMAALQSGNIEQLAKVNPDLAMLLNAAVGDPMKQIGLLTNFLENALAGSMPTDMLQSWISTINRIGSQFARQMSTEDLSRGGKTRFDSQTFAHYLTNMLGPRLGL